MADATIRTQPSTISLVTGVRARAKKFGCLGLLPRHYRPKPKSVICPRTPQSHLADHTVPNSTQREAILCPRPTHISSTRSPETSRIPKQDWLCLRSGIRMITGPKDAPSEGSAARKSLAPRKRLLAHTQSQAPQMAISTLLP